MSSAPRTVLEPELDVLASVYSFVLKCGEARRAEEKNSRRGEAPDGGDGTRIKEDSAYADILPRQG